MLVEMPEFAEDLNTTCGHGSLIELNTREIKLAEQMKHYIERRAKIDNDYADKLSKLHTGITLSSAESTSLVEKAWRTFVTEGENKAITVARMAKILGSSSVGRIDKLIHYKKQVLNDCNLYHCHVEKDFHCCTDEVKRLSDSYRDTVRDLSKAKERMNNNTIKLKGEKDVRKFCERMDKNSRKLSCNHNDYVLSIAAANEHQRLYTKQVRPHFLETMEKLMQTCVEEWKNVLDEIYSYTLWCKEEFTTSAAEVKQGIDAIDPTIEYEGFLEKCREKKGKPVLPFFFDATLMAKECHSTGVTANEIILNDLTFEQLKAKLNLLQSQIDSLDSSIKSKEEEVNKETTGANVHKDEIGEETPAAKQPNLSLFDTLDTLIHSTSRSRELQDMNCKRTVCEVQHHIISPLLEELGDNPPPAYSKFETQSSGLNISDLKPENGRSLMSRFGRQSTTLPRLFTNMMPKRERQPSGSQVNSPTTPTAPNVVKGVEEVHDTSNDTIDDDLGEYVEPLNENALEEQTWFHGKIDRSVVAKLLKNNGDFLVREKSDGSGDCVLSVMSSTQMKHFILKKQSTGMYKFEGSSFETIPQLILHHSKYNVPVSAASNVFIVNPIDRVFIKGDQYCFLHSDVELGEILGKGHFGDVCKGHIKSRDLTVAVKTCRQNAEESTKQKFLAEAEIMKPYDHQNVVALVGVCNDVQPYYILMEFAPHGDLLNYLKKNGATSEGPKLLGMCVDVACGMAYLESKLTIHRDLAARNCLVGDDLVVKICDFGMSREEDSDGVYTVQSTREFPVKWTAPEVWQYKKYTTKSDVWSFGIVMWEIFSLGEMPYPGWSNPRARDAIEEGYRMPPPTGTPPAAYEIMQICWKSEADNRPSFSELYHKLTSIQQIFQ